ncbi:regulation of asymmetric cell division [Asimina triloba]
MLELQILDSLYWDLQTVALPCRSCLLEPLASLTLSIVDFIPDNEYEEGIIVEQVVPLIKASDISAILDPVLKPPADLEARKRISVVACKCVSMWGKARPSIDRVTPALEHALAYLLGSLCNETPFLPTEMETVEAEDLRCGFRAPSWITFPSVVSSQRRKSSVSEVHVDARITDGRNAGGVSAGGDGL